MSRQRVLNGGSITPSPSRPADTSAGGPIDPPGITCFASSISTIHALRASIQRRYFECAIHRSTTAGTGRVGVVIAPHSRRDVLAEARARPLHLDGRRQTLVTHGASRHDAEAHN